MNYTVLLRRRAEAALLGYLLRAADKPALLAVARRLADRLGRNPGRVGESRGPGRRWASVRPFSVLFRIDRVNRVVTVETIRWAGW